MTLEASPNGAGSKKSPTPTLSSFELMLRAVGVQTCYLSWNTSTALDVGHLPEL